MGHISRRWQSRRARPAGRLGRSASGVPRNRHDRSSSHTAVSERVDRGLSQTPPGSSSGRMLSRRHSCTWASHMSLCGARPCLVGPRSVSSNCSDVPPVRSNKLPAQPHPPERPTTAQDAWEPQLGEPLGLWLRVRRFTQARKWANHPSLPEPRLLSVAGLRPGILFRALLWVGALRVAAVKRVLSFVMDVRELAPAAGVTAPTIGR